VLPTPEIETPDRLADAEDGARAISSRKATRMLRFMISPLWSLEWFRSGFPSQT
jgi:hypothetical protein